MRKKKSDTLVLIELPIEGFHKWRLAPPEVVFLRSRHRHTFRVRMAFEVDHDDRDQEIFLLRDEVARYLHGQYGQPCEFDGMSCESIARELLKVFNGYRCAWVEVWEEHTGGARVNASR